MNEITTGLIPCPTCKHEIGTQADNCPKCGSPNTWMHPRIQAMYEAKSFETTRSFRFWHKGAEVWGESQYHSVLACLGAVMIVVIGLLSTVFWFLLGPAIGGLGVAIFWHITAKKDTFKANLITGSWESNNDAYWKPVAVFLGINTK